MRPFPTFVFLPIAALLCVASLSYAQIDACEVIECAGEKPFSLDDLGRDGLYSPFWARELVGADLSVDEFSTEREPTLVAVIDDGFSLSDLPEERVAAHEEKLTAAKHGTEVANLIVGKSPFGISATAKLSYLWALLDFTPQPGGALEEKARSLADSGAQLVNFSQGVTYTQEEIWASVFAVFQRRRIISVTSAGNEPGTPVSRFKTRDRFIVVGSLGPYGSAALRTQMGESVLFLAPGEAVATQSTAGVTVRQSGTSFAAPIVTATLADIMAILGSVSKQEAEAILKLSALKTLNAYEQPRINGFGTLNHYRALRFAQRLAARGNEYRQELINNPMGLEDLLDWKEEASELLAEARDLISVSAPHNLRQSLQLARKAFLLGESWEAAQLVAELYERIGLRGNARFYLTFNPDRAKAVEAICSPCERGSRLFARARDQAARLGIPFRFSGGSSHPEMKKGGQQAALIR